MTSHFLLLTSDFQLFFTSDSVRYEAGVVGGGGGGWGEGVENVCALDALLIYWGGRK